MEFKLSSSLEIDGGALEEGGSGGRHKRLCTRFSISSQPESTFYTQCASGQTFLEQAYSDSTCRASTVHSRWTSAVDFDGVSRQRVGNIQGQTLFHPNTPSHSSLSSDHGPRPSWPEEAGATGPTYHQITDIQASLHPASNAFGYPHPSDSTILLQPTAKPNVSSDWTGLPEIGAIRQYDCQEPTSGGSSRLEKSGDSEQKTTYEVCLGLVGQVICRVTLADRAQSDAMSMERSTEHFTDQHCNSPSIQRHIRNDTSRPIDRQIEFKRFYDHRPLCPQEQQQ